MAIDSSVYFQAQPVQIPDQLNRLAALGQVQQGVNQNRLAQYQLDRAARDDQQALATADAWKNGLNPDGTPNYQKVIGNLAGAGAGASIPAVQKSAAEAQKAQREAEKATLEQAIQKQALISQAAGSATDQATWTAARNRVAQMGVDVSQVPEQYDPATAKQIQLQALTGVQQLDQHWKQMGYDLDVRKQSEVERNNRLQNDAPRRQALTIRNGTGYMKGIV